MDWLRIATEVAVVALPPLAIWISHRIRTPKAHERAWALDTIARGAAALIVSQQPDSKWADLLKAVVNAISTAAGTPTQNGAAIERAAAAALLALGVRAKP